MSLLIKWPKEYEKDGETKTAWITLGRAFKNNDKLTLYFDTIPTNWDGKCMVLKQEDKPQRAESNDGWDKQGGSAPNDEIPFAPLSARIQQ